MSIVEGINFLGLVLNFLGSIFIASSVIKNPGGAHQVTHSGDKIYLASINRRRFLIGIGLLVLGFLLQGISFILMDIVDWQAITKWLEFLGRREDLILVVDV